jgi:glycosyltransferase involved in cell wall biosynthesis
MNNKTLKTAHLTNYYHENSGGISTFYNQMLEFANQHQREMVLIVPGAKAEVKKIGEYAKIYFVPAMRSPVFDRRYRIMMPWKFLLPGTRIRKILLEEKPDLIEICDKYSISFLAALIRKNWFSKLGRPVLVHFSCERLDDNISAYVANGAVASGIARRIMSNFNVPIYDFYIAVSTYIAEEYFLATSSKANPRRSKKSFNWWWRFFRAAKLPLEGRVFHNLRTGPDVIFSEKNYSDDFRREIREEIGIPQDSKIIFYAGRLSPEKNIGVLLEMMKVLAKDETEDYRLVVAGGGPLEESFQKDFESQLPNKLKMLGHLTDRQKLADLYANCDVFVHPNPREPSGNGPLEAMASGAAVVAPNSGGILTYATQDNCWLVEPTGENYAHAVKEIFANPKRTRQKKVNAIQTAKENNREKILGETFEFYEQMYQDFQHRKDLYAYQNKAKDFDFAQEIADNLE